MADGFATTKHPSGVPASALHPQRFAGFAPISLINTWLPEFARRKPNYQKAAGLRPGLGRITMEFLRQKFA
jgi:hypothetical protein